MNTIADDFASYMSLGESQSLDFLDADAPSDEFWDNEPTVELCHELDGAACELCGCGCLFVTGGG